jgi:uncharacterized membrane protein
VLSEREREIWTEIEDIYRDEAAEVARALEREAKQREPRRLEDAPAALVAGFWISFLLVLFGAPVAGLALGAATGLLLLLWRYRPAPEDRPVD